MIANQEKVIHLEKSESSSELENIINSSSSSSSSSSKKSSSKSSSSSKPRIDKLNFNSSPKFQDYNNYTKSKTEAAKGNNQPFAKGNNEQFAKGNNEPFAKGNNEPFAKSNNIPNIEPTFIPSKELSPQEIRMKKIELLRRLSEIKAKGYSLTKEYDFNSSIEEMEYEYGLLKSFADKRNGTKLYKSILLNGISLMEFANDKYDPFDFKLSGWSEHMSVEVDSYDDIIEELYEKYKGSGKSTPPEVRLIFLILASGAAFHFSKTQLGGIPGVSSAASGMIGKMVSPEKKQSQFMSAQEINIEKQKQMLREREKELKQQQMNRKKNPVNESVNQVYEQQINQPMNQQFNQPMNQQFNQTQNQQFNQPMNQQFNQPMNQQFNQPQNQASVVQNYNILPPNITQQYRSTTRDAPEIRAPSNVQDILSRIKTIQQNNNNDTTETQEETTTNNDRLVSESTYSDNKKRGRKPKKSVISINTD